MFNQHLLLFILHIISILETFLSSKGQPYK